MDGDAEFDRAAGGALFELQELGSGSVEADLQALDLSESSLCAGHVDPGEEVVPDVEEAVSLALVGAQERAAHA